MLAMSGLFCGLEFLIHKTSFEIRMEWRCSRRSGGKGLSDWKERWIIFLALR